VKQRNFRDAWNLIIFPFVLQTVITAQVLSAGGERIFLWLSILKRHKIPPSCSRQHLSYGDCLEVKR